MSMKNILKQLLDMNEILQKSDLLLRHFCSQEQAASVYTKRQSTQQGVPPSCQLTLKTAAF